MGWRRGRYRYNSYNRSRDSQRQALSSTFAGIDQDIERIFLSLPTRQLESIFSRYGKEHGASALTYARRTYDKWKTSQVRMSGQIAERLLKLVPPYLSASERFDLVKKLRAAHLRPSHQSLSTSPQTWRVDLAPLIRDIVTRSSSFELPASMVNRVKWLANGDATATQKLLAAAEQEEALVRLRYLEVEFQRINALVQKLNGTHSSIRHKIDLPQGSIAITIELPKKTFWQTVQNWWS